MREEFGIAWLERGVEFRVVGQGSVHAPRRGVAEETVQTVNSFSLQLLWDGEVGFDVIDGGRDRVWKDVEESIDLSLGDLDCRFRNGEGRHEESTV